MRAGLEDLRPRLDDTTRKLQDAELRLREIGDRLRLSVRLLAFRGEAFAELERARRSPVPKDAALPRQPRVRAPRWQPDEAGVRAIEEEIAASGLFSPAWYRAQYDDLPAGDDASALRHFARYGLGEDRDPHPLFSTAWYRRCASLDEAGEAAPFLHFLRSGAAAPHPLFDPDFYRDRRPDVGEAGVNPLAHYVRDGWRELCIPHPAFDPGFYARARGRAGPPEADPLAEYVTDEQAFGVPPHRLFDPAHYRGGVERAWPATAGAPLVHYLVRGWREGRSPHPLFDDAWYLDRNPDVAAAGLQPLVHFLRYGADEGRETHPMFDAGYYARTNPDVGRTGVAPLLHYVTDGAAENRSPHPDFPGDAVARLLPADPARPVSAPIRLLQGGTRLSPAALAVVATEPRSAEPPIGLSPRLRDYVVDRYGEGPEPLLRDLMQVVGHYGAAPDAFGSSSDLDRLVGRARAASAGRAGEDVDASIVIPVHNALVFTLTCIVALLEIGSRSRFEILVGDDASTDRTAEAVGAIGGRVRLVRHAANLGFLGNCNAVAAHARGRYVVLLNNDTLPLPGWLDALVETFERDPKAGLVGSKLLNGDGSLQEAGGILWRDGSAWNFGRNGDPAASIYNYVKDVDYCSGASIAVPRELWTRLGGFDPDFAPAYCEDSDLAFRVREAGFRTLYQPFSEIIHHEGRSHGTDTASGIKAYQVANQRKLFARWSATLAAENWPNGDRVFLARDRSGAKPHLLVVDHYIPQWDRDAGSRTMLHFVRAFLDRGFHVTFWPENLYHDRAYAEPLQRMGVEVLYGPEYAGGFERWWAEHGSAVGVVLLSRPHIAPPFLDVVRRRPGATVLYYGHDLHWRRLEGELAVTGDAALRPKIERMRAEELAICRASDLALYPSEDEVAVLRAELSPDRRVAAVPAWIFDDAVLAGARDGIGRLGRRERHHVMFVGGFTHTPNVDGLTWFAEAVLPRLKAHDARFRVSVAGSNPPEAVARLAGDDVAILGQVSDERLATLYETASVAVVPLRFGGGVKGKVIEGFSKGIPVVATSVGMQGIPDPGSLAFVADEPEDFAAAVLAACDDRALATRKARAAVDFLGSAYSTRAFRAKLAPVVPEFREGAA